MSDKNLIQLIPDSIDNAVKNLTDSPTKAIGQTLSDIWFLTIGGAIHQLAEKRNIRYALEANKFKAELEQKLNQIPEDKMVEPDFQTVASAFNNARFCLENEKIRNMFTELIASASNSDKANQVLPIFSDIILKLTPRDASNLAAFGTVANHPIAIYREWAGELHYHDAFQNVFLLNPEFQDLRAQEVSINTLSSLGLISVTYSKSFDNSSYAEFYETDEYNELVGIAEERNSLTYTFPPDMPKPVIDFFANPSRVEIVKGMVELTALGSAFKQICLP